MESTYKHEYGGSYEPRDWNYWAKVRPLEVLRGEIFRCTDCSDDHNGFPITWHQDEVLEWLLGDDAVMMCPECGSFDLEEFTMTPEETLRYREYVEQRDDIRANELWDAGIKPVDDPDLDPHHDLPPLEGR